MKDFSRKKPLLSIAICFVSFLSPLSAQTELLIEKTSEIPSAEEAQVASEEPVLEEILEEAQLAAEEPALDEQESQLAVEESTTEESPLAVEDFAAEEPAFEEQVAEETQLAVEEPALEVQASEEAVSAHSHPSCECPEKKPLFQTPGGRGVVLVSSKEYMLDAKEQENFSGVEIIGLDVPGGYTQLLSDLQPYTWGAPFHKEAILEIKEIIQRYYTKEGRPFVEVIVPRQDITDGVLQVLVIESRVGTIHVQEDCYTSYSLIERSVPFRPGDRVDVNKIEQGVDFLNRNPFRRVDAIYYPGSVPGTTDIDFLVESRFPGRAYVGFDNTGVLPTHRERLYSGFSIGRVFNLNHVMNYQYTASTNFSKLQAHTGQYIAMLPWLHVLNMYGGYSWVHADLAAETSSNHGRSGQASLRYTVPLTPSGRSHTDISFGFDYKTMNNVIQFNPLFEIEPSNATVKLAQLVGVANGTFDARYSRIDWEAEVFWSPAKFLPDQTNADYNALRPGAKVKYVYARGSIRYLQYLPRDFSLTLWARGQISSKSLLATEQYGMGGYETVRGYDERQLNGDYAFNANAEIRTPFAAVFSRKKKKDALQGVLFIDYGWIRNHTTSPGEPRTGYLLGAGPGLRYNYDSYVSARFDWGIKCHTEDFFTGGWSMIHFAFNVAI